MDIPLSFVHTGRMSQARWLDRFSSPFPLNFLNPQATAYNRPEQASF